MTAADDPATDTNTLNDDEEPCGDNSCHCGCGRGHVCGVLLHRHPKGTFRLTLERIPDEAADSGETPAGERLSDQLSGALDRLAAEVDVCSERGRWLAQVDAALIRAGQDEGGGYIAYARRIDQLAAERDDARTWARHGVERWTGPGEPGWIHSPGSDTPCLDARPRRGGVEDIEELRVQRDRLDAVLREILARCHGATVDPWSAVGVRVLQVNREDYDRWRAAVGAGQGTDTEPSGRS